MQIIQARPSIRQNALADALAQGVNNFSDAYQKSSETARQMALKDQETALQLRKEGYDVTSDMVAQSRQTEPTGLEKFFGAKSPEKVDLYGKRTDQYIAKQKADAEDRKYKMDGEILDRQFKRSQMVGHGIENQRKLFEMNDIASGNKFKREVNQDQQKKLHEKNTNLFNVKNGMDAALSQLENPNLSEQDKIKVGQGLLKLLNSAEGSDAVGAEEAKRIGSYLEHKMFNVFEPGSMFGRDLDLFTDQVRNNSLSLADRIKRNEDGANALGSGQSLAEYSSNGQQLSGNNIALRPTNFRGSNPGVQFSPTKIPNASPIQNAQAGNMRSIDNNSLMSRREELLRKKQGR